MRALLADAEDAAAGIIRARRDDLERLVAELEARETLQREAIEACLGPCRVPGGGPCARSRADRADSMAGRAPGGDFCGERR